MKITEITRDDYMKISANSWTVKHAHTLKTKGVIRGITPIMKLQARKLFDIHQVLKKYGIEKYRGNIYSDGDNLYYPHNVSDFYEQQIARFGKVFDEKGYNAYLAKEKEIDELRNCPILTVIDCRIVS